MNVLCRFTATSWSFPFIVRCAKYVLWRRDSQPPSQWHARSWISIHPSKTDNEHPSRKDDAIRSFIYLKLISRPGSWLVGIFDLLDDRWMNVLCRFPATFRSFPFIVRCQGIPVGKGNKASQPVSERHARSQTNAQCRGRGGGGGGGDVDEKISLQNHFSQAWNSLSIPPKQKFSEELSFLSNFWGNFLREFCSILSSFVRFILLVHRSWAKKARRRFDHGAPTHDVLHSTAVAAAYVLSPVVSLFTRYFTFLEVFLHGYVKRFVFASLFFVCRCVDVL